MVYMVEFISFCLVFGELHHHLLFFIFYFPGKYNHARTFNAFLPFIFISLIIFLFIKVVNTLTYVVVYDMIYIYIPYKNGISQFLLLI